MWRTSRCWTAFTGKSSTRAMRCSAWHAQPGPNPTPSPGSPGRRQADHPASVPLEQVTAAAPILMLEDVQYSDNLGSILRTCFCLGVRSVIATNAAWSALREGRTSRCAMGCSYHLRYHRTDSMVEAAKVLAAAGIAVYGAELGPTAVRVRRRRRLARGPSSAKARPLSAGTSAWGEQPLGARAGKRGPRHHPAHAGGVRRAP